MAHDDNHDLHGERDGALAFDRAPKLKQPQRYKVLVHNDDYTTMEFVVMVLEVVFHRPEPDAVRIMLHVHKEGAGVAGVYSYEVAEARIAKAARLAREHEFPLRCTMEPEQ
jgi:ATP-dependent Clp protease adaptor protein ClpS